MKSKLPREAIPPARELLTLVFALLLVLSIAILSYDNWLGFRSANRQFDETRRILRATNTIVSTLTDAETGQRGFLLTGRESYLDPYRDAISRVGQNLTDLTNLTAQRPDQGERVAALTPLVQKKLNELHETIDVRRSKGLDAALALVLSDQGKVTMDEIRKLCAEIETIGDSRSAVESAEAQSRSSRLGWISTGGTVALFVFLLLATATIQRGTLRREELMRDLYESRELFQTTLTSIGDAVIATDTEAKITFLNGIAESLTGWTWQEAAGQPLQKLFAISNEETGAAVENPVDKALREGKVVGLANHTKLAAKNGGQISIDDSAAPIRDANGQVTGVVLVFRDITERRRAETSRDEAHALLQAFTSSSPLGFAFFDQDLRYRMINHALAEMNGLPVEAHIGRAVEEVLPNVAGAARSLYRQVAETGSPVIDYERTAENPKAPGETRNWSESWFPVKTKSGALLGVGAVVLETTERKRAERALQASEARLRLFIEHAPAAMAMFDRDMRYLAVSRRWLTQFGLRNEDVIGRAHYDVLPEIPERWKEVHRRCLAGGVESCDEDSLERADGRLQWLRWEVRPWNSDSGDIGGIVIFNEDITERRHMEQARRESEERYRATFANAPVGIAHVGLDGRWLHFNRAVCDITGYSEEELHARTFADITHPGDIEADWAMARRLASGEIPTYRVDKRYLRKDGPIIWVNLTVSLLRDPSGAPQHYISVIQDVTARKAAEEALRDSERQLRSMVDSIDQLAWMANADGWIFFYNKRWYEYTGTTPAAMEGWGWQSVHHPAVLPEVIEKWNTAIRTGQPFDMVFPLRGADGRYRRFLTRGNPVRDHGGRIIRWFGTNTDIEALERVQQSLRDAEERLHVALAAGDIGTWEFHPVTGELKWDDRCRTIFGVAADSHLDYGVFLSLLHPEDRKAADDAVQEALDPARTGEYKIDYRVLRPDGTALWVLATGKAFCTGTGSNRHAARFIGTVVDITERKTREEELRRANQDLNQFAFAASHDLQEPLRMITAYSQMLVRGHRGELDENAEMCVGYIVEGARRMRDLLSDLLAYTSVDAKIPDAMEAVDLNQVLQEVVNTLSPAIEESGAVVSSDPLPAVEGRRAHFLQLLQNLVGNAIKYRSQRPPRIHVSAGRHREQWLLSVTDNGIGIPAEYHQEVFGVFKRLHGRKIPGTGIGLAICQRVVENYKGRIWVESEAGHGATFYFTMPAFHKQGVRRESA